jgi:hypothetical protein
MAFQKNKKNYWNIELKSDFSECKLSESMHYSTQQIPPSINYPPIKVIPKIEEMIQPKKRYFCKFFFAYLNILLLLETRWR